MLEDKDQAKVSRRRFLAAGSAVLVAAAGMQVAQGQEKTPIRSADHHLPDESQPVRPNDPLDKENPSSVWAPETDAGGQPPF